MRVIFLICVSVYVVVGQDVNNMLNMPKYDERYDYLDVDMIFSNKRLIRNYVDCLINAHRCSPEGKVLKRILPEALRTKCVRCTERQKRTAVKMIKRLKNEYPEEWSKLSSRWDPTGDFTRYFEEFLAKEHFNTISGSGNGNPIASTIPLPPQISSEPIPPQATPPRPIALNRFGADVELMTGGSSTAANTVRPLMTQRTTARPDTKPTMMTWAGVATNTQSTRFPLRPVSNLPQPYTTAITLIDQIGYKIIKTTELVTGILKNTVRAVVGR